MATTPVGAAPPAEGYGAIFDNGPQRHPRAPTWRGMLKLNGKVYRVAGWSRTGHGGAWVSLVVDLGVRPTPRKARRDAEPAKPVRASDAEPF